MASRAHSESRTLKIKESLSLIADIKQKLATRSLEESTAFLEAEIKPKIPTFEPATQLKIANVICNCLLEIR